MKVARPKAIVLMSGGDGLAFKIPVEKKMSLAVILSWGGGWDHASVHGIVNNSDLSFTPTWKDMCMIKNLCWKKEEWVIQYHPAETEYINIHNNVLHLWRPQGKEIPKPPKVFV